MRSAVWEVTRPARKTRHASSWIVFVILTILSSIANPLQSASAAVPTVTSVSMAYGAKSGGTTTIINGTGFLGTTSVTVGGGTATISNITDTALTIVTPSSATTGAKSIVVTNADGSVTYANGFTYSDSAVSCGTSGSFFITGSAVIAAVNCVGSVDVPSGVATINGCTFGNAAGGNCGTLSGNAVTSVILPSSIRTIAGAAFLGAGTMTSIYIPEGLTTIGNSAFYYSGKHPINIPTTVINIDSAFYRSNVTEVTFSTPTSLTAIGASTFRATANLTSLVLPEGITSLASIALGDVASPATAIKWVSLPSTLTSVVTTGNTTFLNLQLTCVVNPGNTAYINGLTYPNNPTIVTDINNCPAPTISAISPSSGTTQGGASVTVVGTNFLNVNSVTIGGVAGTINTRSATAITFTSPPGTVGVKDVMVNTYGPDATLTSAYTYLPLPTITSLSVTSGPITGGTVTVVTGTNLSSITSATLGGSAATRGANTSTSISLTTPSATLGLKNLVLVNANGTVTLTDAFTYVEQITSFSVFSIAGSVKTTPFRTPIVISATVAYASKVTFSFRNIRIPGCIGKLTTTSGPFTVTCTWKPSNTGAGQISAVAVATTAGITSGIAPPINISVVRRSNQR